MECIEDNEELQPQSIVDYTVAPNDHDYAEEPKPLLELQAVRLHIEEQQQNLDQIGLEKFGLERFSTDPKKIKFYTDFTSYDILKSFYQCIILYVQTMETWIQFQQQHNTSRGSKVHLIDQLFMFLHKLRLRSLDQDLADKFSAVACWLTSFE